MSEDPTFETGQDPPPADLAVDRDTPLETVSVRREPIWGWADVGLFFGLGLPTLLVAQLVVVLMAGAFGAKHDNPFVLVAGQAVAYALLFTLLALILRVQYSAPFWSTLGWRQGRIQPGTAALCGVVLAFSIALLGGLLHVPDVESPMQKLLRTPHGLLVLSLFGTTVGPVAEELAFRGFLQPLLVRNLGAVPGILIAAFAFGLLHLSQNAGSWPHIALISLAGIGFGVLRQVSGSTQTSILAHAAYNLTLFVAFFAGRNTR